jgi:hypothetical protein
VALAPASDRQFSAKDAGLGKIRPGMEETTVRRPFYQLVGLESAEGWEEK